MPFDPSDDTWWPNPWPPRTGPGGGTSYPYDWIDPNPYAVPAALEAATWLLGGLDGAAIGPVRGVAGAVERGAAEAALQAAKAAADSPALTQAAKQIVMGRYGKLSGTLPAGFQANHLNQNAVYGSLIPEKEGLSVAMEGNIITQPGSPHYNYHRSLEQFWDQYRPGGSLQFRMPTNAEYGEASRRALIASGFSPAQASDLAGKRRLSAPPTA
jgi:hypothetical protein